MWHTDQTLRDQESTHHSPPIPFPSLSSIWWRWRKKAWRTAQGRSCNKVRIFVNFEKISEVEDDLLFPRSPPFYWQMDEYTTINVSLENTQVPEKSSHSLKRLPNRGDDRLTVAIKPLWCWESNRCPYDPRFELMPDVTSDSLPPEVARGSVVMQEDTLDDLLTASTEDRDKRSLPIDSTPYFSSANSDKHGSA